MTAMVWALAISGAALAGDVSWKVLEHHSVRMDIPAFIVEGYANAIFAEGRDVGTSYNPSDARISEFSLYSITTSSRPYEYLRGESKAFNVSYRVDHALFGLISWQDGDAIFYGACKRASKELTCFELQYPESSQSIIDEALPRMLRTFKQ
jgi:hypothetical protein